MEIQSCIDKFFSNVIFEKISKLLFFDSRIWYNDGLVVGSRVGCTEGPWVGENDGCIVGHMVGLTLGLADGNEVGSMLGYSVGNLRNSIYLPLKNKRNCLETTAFQESISSHMAL